MKKKLVVGTRTSALALWQAEHIADCLRKQYPQTEVVLEHIVTTGDKILDVPLAKIGGKGLFTKELETAMLAGKIDIAVHSLKDMPTELPEGLVLAATTKRATPWDALVSPKHRTLENLPEGASVGTSSLRRKAQLLNRRPDLKICDLRGNLNTRMNKLETQNLDAIVLAEAGLLRMGWADKITQVLPPDISLPAVGQGSLAIEACADNSELLAMLEFLNDEDTRAAVTAERAFLRELEGGCQVPMGVYGRIKEGQVYVQAVILSLDGKRVIRDSVTCAPSEAEVSGTELARRMYANGGKEILEELVTINN